MDRRIPNNNIRLYQDFPILIPYNLDLVNDGHNILYRTTTKPYTLKSIDHDISLALGKYGTPAKFESSEAIIVTFDNIFRYGNAGSRFKYQAVIATDYTNTFAILNYDRLDESGYEVGYGDSTCNYIKQFTTSADKTDLTRTSNVGIPGKHIYLLTQEECMNCKNNIFAIIFFKQIILNLFRIIFVFNRVLKNLNIQNCCFSKLTIILYHFSSIKNI